MHKNRIGPKTEPCGAPDDICIEIGLNFSVAPATPAYSVGDVFITCKNKS